MPDRYAYLGPPGTFTQQALLSTVGADTELVPMPGVPAVCAAVRDGSVEFGLVPLENSVEGPIPTTTDELVVGQDLQIVREVFLDVTFVLAARRGVALGEVRTVATHPHAEAQVRGWLAANLPEARYTALTSTAEAASRVADGEYDAAVCASIAARNNDLDVLAERIEDSAGAVTRFAVLARPGSPPPATGNDRTSFVVHIRQEQPGALSGVLTELASRSINLTRIESRPWRERIGEYHFILECEGHIADPRVGEALAALHRICADVLFLGSYPRADRANEALPAYATDEVFDEASQWLAQMRGGESTE
ncbi:prephenate dehydratase [Epidermidibacterium keratini]|uniref:Prephenate dehydratase n=1 Tax=Epidermidibacterium keratini TaxID=1891644 RepID=A0A7L4YNZ4_9ACTN|nr:prephenate dehydratase [Epidermidibacterium keratini]QHC00752.1 prephenate dehydratase [Epidermidibacterium keratini]